jgi:anti-anti-sigma factor
MKFLVDSVSDGGIILLKMAGELDRDTSRALYANVKSLANRVPSAIGYDLRDVTFINAAGFGAMLMSHEYLQGRNLQIYDFLVSPANDVVLGLHARLGMHRKIPYKKVSTVLSELVANR